MRGLDITHKKASLCAEDLDGKGNASKTNGAVLQGVRVRAERGSGSQEKDVRY